MAHRDPGAMHRNARAAVPRPGEDYRSANQIYLLQGKPKLPRGELRDLLETLAGQGTLEAITVNRVRYYRSRRMSTGIAFRQVAPYNGGSREDFPLSQDADSFASALLPLRQGKPVFLWMEIPAKVQPRGLAASRKLVVIVPGSALGAPRDTVLIAIIGSGSCLVRLDKPRVADLVLARMPAKLAHELVGKIQKVMSA